MDDLIKRQDAITAYCEHECGIKGMTRENCGATDCGTIFDDIPSAQPYTENDYIAEFIKERHPYMLDSFSFSAWKLKRSWYNLCQTFKDALQQRGTVVTCGIDKCKHNDDGLCKAESIYLSEDHDCDGGCDDGWVFDEKEEFED